MKVEKIIFIIEKTMEQLERSMLKVDTNKLIPGTIDFGDFKIKKTGEDFFYYVARLEV